MDAEAQKLAEVERDAKLREIIIANTRLRTYPDTVRIARQCYELGKSAAMRPMSDEGGAWETFSDPAYFEMWCVREVGERRWGHGFHVMTQQEAEGLRDLLNGRPALSPDSKGEEK